mmetsp:Transcript_24407/g.37627  ORF Transcript_24407/g.37627 Transcript_24407/m.37627 type:complete len:103 (-) Transcript_24407:587-895(-)
MLDPCSPFDARPSLVMVAAALKKASTYIAPKTKRKVGVSSCRKKCKQNAPRKDQVAFRFKTYREKRYIYIWQAMVHHTHQNYFFLIPAFQLAAEMFILILPW